MASVSFHNIYKNFGDVKVIRCISFDIQDGEFVVLVGPSGCGYAAFRLIFKTVNLLF